MTVQNTVRSYLGIAKESAKGTAVAATGFVPVAAGKFKSVDVIDPLFDEGLRGSMVKTYNYIPGRKRSTVDFGGAVFADTFGWPLAGLMGVDTTTGASDPYTHTVTLKNATAVGADAQPTSFTITDYYGAAVRQFAGCQIHDLTLNFSAEGLLEYDAKSTGWASVVTTAPTTAFSTVRPTPVWQATVSIGGSQVSTAVEGSIAMSRPVTPIYGIANTQNPYQIFTGPLSATGQLRFVMEDDTELTRYLTNTQPAIVINWTNGVSGAGQQQIQATLTKGAYTAASVERGKDYVEILVDLTGVGNTTDGGGTQFSPIAWVLKNQLAGSIYQ